MQRLVSNTDSVTSNYSFITLFSKLVLLVKFIFWCSLNWNFFIKNNILTIFKQVLFDVIESVLLQARDLHYSEGVWNLTYKFHLYLIIIIIFKMGNLSKRPMFIVWNLLFLASNGVTQLPDHGWAQTSIWHIFPDEG